MEEKNQNQTITIQPEVRQYRTLGFNRIAIRDLMTDDPVNHVKGIPMNAMRSTTARYNNGQMLSDKTVKRWQQGEDIYLSVLLNVCDELRIDPLRWICVDGQPLKSTIEDLYRLEQSGTDCATLLRERGIEPADYSDHKPLGKNQWDALMAEREEIIANCQRRGREYSRTQHAKTVSTLDNIGVIQEVARIQREAFEHENHSVAIIRREYQQLLEEANIRAGAAENEVRRLRDELRRMNEMLAHIHEGGISDIDEPSGMTAADDAQRE